MAQDQFVTPIPVPPIERTSSKYRSPEDLEKEWETREPGLGECLKTIRTIFNKDPNFETLLNFAEEVHDTPEKVREEAWNLLRKYQYEKLVSLEDQDLGNIYSTQVEIKRLKEKSGTNTEPVTLKSDLENRNPGTLENIMKLEELENKVNTLDEKAPGYSNYLWKAIDLVRGSETYSRRIISALDNDIGESAGLIWDILTEFSYKYLAEFRGQDFETLARSANSLYTLVKSHSKSN